MRLAALFTTLLLACAPLLAPAPALATSYGNPHSCTGYYCWQVDPYQEHCAPSATATVPVGAGTLTLYWSSTCEAAWAYLSNAAAGDPFFVQGTGGYGQSWTINPGYDYGWTNMVPADAPFTASACGTHAGLQTCTSALPGNGSYQPSRQCYGYYCSGIDPYQERCAPAVSSSAQISGATLTLYWSSICGASWAYMTNGAAGDFFSVVGSSGEGWTINPGYNYGWTNMVGASVSGESQACGYHAGVSNCTAKLPA